MELPRQDWDYGYRIRASRTSGQEFKYGISSHGMSRKHTATGYPMGEGISGGGKRKEKSCRQWGLWGCGDGQGT